MQKLKKLAVILLAAAFYCGGMTFTVYAADSGNVKNKIVVFKSNASEHSKRKYLRHWQDKGCRVGRHLPLVNGIVLRSSAKMHRNRLADDDCVKSVEDDQMLVTIPVVATGEGGAGEGGAANFVTFIPGEPGDCYRPWSVVKLHGQAYLPGSLMDIYDPSILPQSLQKAEGPVKLAVFDTGVDWAHSSLDGVVRGGIDLVNLPTGVLLDEYLQTHDQIPVDDNGHGTHVGGIIAGRQISLGEGFDLYAVKILDENAMGSLSTVINALDWAIRNKIDVVNMSIAFREDSPAIHMAVQQAYQAGIVMVAAAGNHSNWMDDDIASGEGGAGEGGAGEGGASNDGTVSDTAYPVMYPAKYPEVIAVGATDEYGAVAAFSNTGPEVDLLAPGTDIVSAYAGGGYGVASGTSMAAPYVTGTVAMMLAYDRLFESRIAGTEPVRKLLVSQTSDSGMDAGEVNLIDTLDATRIYSLYGMMDVFLQNASVPY